MAYPNGQELTDDDLEALADQHIAAQQQAQPTNDFQTSSQLFAPTTPNSLQNKGDFYPDPQTGEPTIVIRSPTPTPELSDADLEALADQHIAAMQPVANAQVDNSSLLDRFRNFDFQNATKGAVGAVSAALNGATLGLGNEAIKLGSAGLGSLVNGVPFSQGYNNTANYLTDARNSLPYGLETGTEVAGSITNPLGALGTVGRGLGLLKAAPEVVDVAAPAVKNTLMSALTKKVLPSAAQGGIYGFETSNGDLNTRLQNAGTNAVVGGLVPVGTSSLGSLAQRFRNGADALEMSSIGITKADLKNSAVRAGIFDPEAERLTHLEQSVQSAKDQGVLAGSKDPQALLQRNRQKLNDLYSELNPLKDELNQKVQNAGIKAKTRFDHANEYIKNNVPSEDKQAFRDELKSIADSQSKELDGSIHSLIKEKTAKAAQVYGENDRVKRGLQQKVAQDLRQTVLNYADIYIPEKAQRFRDIYEKASHLENLDDFFKRTAAGAKGDDILKQYIALQRTSGGFGTAMNLAAHAGGGIAAIGAGVLGHGLNSGAGKGILADTALPLGSSAAKGTANFIANNPRTAAVIPGKLLEGSRAIDKQNLDRIHAIPPKHVYDPSKRAPWILEKERLQKAAPKTLIGALTRELGNRASATIRPAPKDTQALIEKALPGANEKGKQLLQVLIGQESKGNPNAVSNKGAMGLMQLMPANVKHFGVSNPFDPAQNIQAGTKLLSEELNRYNGDTKLALAAYNAGSPRVNKAIKDAKTRNFTEVSKHLPAKTQDYVQNISGNLG